MKKFILLLIFSAVLINAQEQEIKPVVHYGFGSILQTVYQQTPDDNYVFEPAMLKVGFLHTNIDIIPGLMASLSYAVHSGKISDAFVQYKVNKHLIIKGGRFKTGTRAGAKTALYDCDFEDFTYTAENLSIASGAPDYRYYGLDISGRYKFLGYAFTLHNSGARRTRYYSQQNDGPTRKNNGFKFKSWELLLSLYPTPELEFGAHVGSINRPGMGDKVNYSNSAYLYYTPENFKFKFDYGRFEAPIFSKTPAITDYSEVPFISVTRQGFSFLAAYAFKPNWELTVRYERFDNGDNAKTLVGYEDLNLYTGGLTWYLSPKNKRLAKISAYYQHRGEGNCVPGFSGPNDMFVIAYQIFFMTNY